MSEGSGAEEHPRRLTRRNFVAASALAGSAALGGAAILAPESARAQTPADPGSRYATRAGAACTPVPNRYNKPFEVCDDEIFIFMANYKPFENEGFFYEVIGKKLAEKFPDIKFKACTWDYPIRYEDLKAAGVVPDIILEDPRRRIDRDLEPLGWVEDLTDKVDVDGLSPAAVELVKSRSDGGMYGVPLFNDDFVLIYNKKIFDDRGVKHPKPGMTYDEAYKLAKKLTYEKDLKAYKGYLQHPDTYLYFNQLGLYPFVPTGSENPAPGDVKINVTSEPWMRLADNMERFLLIPRCTFTTVDDVRLKGRVAMAVDRLWKFMGYNLNEHYIPDGDEDEWKGQCENLDLGVSSVPVLGGKDQYTYQPNTIAAFLPPQSRKKEQALEVVKWLISEEAQVELSRHGIKPARESDAIVSAFGEAIPELQGIDTSGVFWGENATVRDYENTEYWDLQDLAFRHYVLEDCLSARSALTVAEREGFPAYIQSQVAAGKDW
ncbi:ABC transporter substrate-binding protein [Streptomyces pathocidini]|uniref:ABC transporter substrate-binding protein n=1 Tax=Streptomyces pathocidini TaxID=1650571 RepID=A0ABW7UV31_9ACTN|nr:extracellular solute-binding protein [Streptomyces pathocidini]